MSCFRMSPQRISRLENWREPGIYLYSADLPRPQAELLGQGADTGADLQHAGGLVHAGFLGDGGRNPGGNEKILPLGLGKVKAALCQQRLHDLNVTNVEHRVSFVSME